LTICFRFFLFFLYRSFSNRSRHAYNIIHGRFLFLCLCSQDFFQLQTYIFKPIICCCCAIKCFLCGHLFLSIARMVFLFQLSLMLHNLLLSSSISLSFFLSHSFAISQQIPKSTSTPALTKTTNKILIVYSPFHFLFLGNNNSLLISTSHTIESRLATVNAITSDTFSPLSTSEVYPQ